ncbi:MAG: hypothetical protein ABI700_12180 [Chloroflexota bacterium]
MFFTRGDLAGFVLPVSAATSVPCDVTALISAINSASSGDRLDLATGCTYTLTVVDNLTLGTTGLLVISTTLTINGHGATITRSSVGGTPDFRIFALASGGDLTLDSLTVSNGSTGFTLPVGVGIYNNGGTRTLRYKSSPSRAMCVRCKWCSRLAWRKQNLIASM